MAEAGAIINGDNAQREQDNTGGRMGRLGRLVVDDTNGDTLVAEMTGLLLNKV